MLSHASGKVLEVAAGTGRNIEFYAPEKVDKVILLDNSKGMLDEAKRKLASLKLKLPPIDIHVTDATELPFPSESFDTVIDTYGLCSVEDVSKVCLNSDAHRVLRIVIGHLDPCTLLS